VGLSSNLKTVALSRLTRRQFLLFSPPDFTGQNKTIVLQGDAVITRIDQENEGVAVEFINALRGFERTNVPTLLQKSDNRIAD
jgi:hypothetical protein